MLLHKRLYPKIAKNLLVSMGFQPSARLGIHRIGGTCQIRSCAGQFTSDPLRVLFCGSDEFSIASLRALYREHERDKALIESIDVVCRPAKPVGRGLKDTREGESSHARPLVLILKQKQYPFL